MRRLLAAGHPSKTFPREKCAFGSESSFLKRQFILAFIDFLFRQPFYVFRDVFIGDENEPGACEAAAPKQPSIHTLRVLDALL